VSVPLMKRTWLIQVDLILGLATLVGCRTAPKREGQQQQAAQITVNTTESSQAKTTASDNCGLDDFPVSESTEEILAAVPPHNARRPNQMMSAKVAIDAEGRVTHLRVLRLAWPELPNSHTINTQAVDSIKRWHYAPTIVGGTPVAVCSDVSVTVDLE
jgi:hypothetical protein